MRRIFAVVCLFVFFGGQATASSSVDLQKSVDPIVDEFAGRKILSGTILVRKGGAQYIRGVHFSSDHHQIKNDAETRFPIASLTKSFVAAAILKLEEMNLLSTGDEALKFLPEFRDLLIEIEGASPTIHQLLNHTSGLPDYAVTPEFRAKMFKGPLLLADLMGFVKEKPLDFRPGKGWNYSNTNYILLGEIIRKVSHQSFTDFLQEKILDPLSLQDTTIDLPLSSAAAIARPYEPAGSGRVDVIDKYKLKFLHMSDVSTDGNLVSTVKDVAVWVEALSTGKALSQDSTKKMFNPSSAAPYGYGWFVMPDGSGRTVYKHGGDWVAWKSYAIRYPDQDVTIVLLTNQPMSGPEGKEFIERVANAVLVL